MTRSMDFRGRRKHNRTRRSFADDPTNRTKPHVEYVHDHVLLSDSTNIHKLFICIHIHVHGKFTYKPTSYHQRPTATDRLSASTVEGKQLVSAGDVIYTVIQTHTHIHKCVHTFMNIDTEKAGRKISPRPNTQRFSFGGRP